jgi:DNA-nicking Smr family endonuclease
MAHDRKNKRFNNPFASLKQQATAVLQHQQQAQARGAARAAADKAARAQAMAAAQAQVNESETFLRAMAGITPLRPSPVREPVGPQARRLRVSDDELVVAELEGLVQGQGSFRVHESEEMRFGVAPGVNAQLLMQLQEGYFAYQRHIDLHGLGRQEAHLAVNRFVALARRDGERCVLIITGRGKSSPDGLSVLRDSLPRWLSRAPCRPHVLAFCTAQSIDGGPGAFYVLLRRPGIKPFGDSLGL